MASSSSFDSEKKKSSTVIAQFRVKYRNEDRINFAIV